MGENVKAKNEKIRGRIDRGLELNFPEGCDILGAITDKRMGIGGVNMELMLVGGLALIILFVVAAVIAIVAGTVGAAIVEEEEAEEN